LEIDMTRPDRSENALSLVDQLDVSASDRKGVTQTLKAFGQGGLK